MKYTKAEILKEEKWKQIKRYPGYSFSWWGGLESLWTFQGVIGKIPKLLNPVPVKLGYKQVTLCVKGVHKACHVHRLVAEAFLGKCPKGKEVLHGKEKGQYRDYLFNIEYGTHKENMDNKRRDGTHQLGSKNPCAKLTEKDIPIIRKMLKKGILQRIIAKKFGVSRGTITRINNRKIWKHVN